MDTPGLETWWRDPETLTRFVSDLVAGELSRLRPGAVLPPRPWPLGLSLVEGELGCDSLELLDLATALAEAVQMHRTGLEDYLLARRTIGEWVAIVAEAQARFSAALSFRTSGSTGAPKTCEHETAALFAEIDELAPLFADRRRIVCAVPSHHIYGFLFSILLPSKLDLPVVDVRASSPAGVAAALRPGDLLIGHPTFWSALSRTSADIAPDVVGVTSTAPCPAELARAVTARGVSRLVQIYGSSETAGIAHRDDPEAPYQLFSYWSRDEAEGRLVRPRGDGTKLAVAAPDQLDWSDDRRFHVRGRHDHAVQVGGINVFPARVRERLREHPLVADAEVRLMAPGEGARLKAFVVPTVQPYDAGALRQELSAWCDAGLTAPERPKAFTFGGSLPATPLGKPSDWSLADPA